MSKLMIIVGLLCAMMQFCRCNESTLATQILSQLKGVVGHEKMQMAFANGAFADGVVDILNDIKRQQKSNGNEGNNGNLEILMFWSRIYTFSNEQFVKIQKQLMELNDVQKCLEDAIEARNDANKIQLLSTFDYAISSGADVSGLISQFMNQFAGQEEEELDLDLSQLTMPAPIDETISSPTASVATPPPTSNLNYVISSWSDPNNCLYVNTFENDAYFISSGSHENCWAAAEKLAVLLDGSVTTVMNIVIVSEANLNFNPSNRRMLLADDESSTTDVCPTIANEINSFQTSCQLRFKFSTENEDDGVIAIKVYLSNGKVEMQNSLSDDVLTVTNIPTELDLTQSPSWNQQLKTVELDNELSIDGLKICDLVPVSDTTEFQFEIEMKCKPGEGAMFKSEPINLDDDTDLMIEIEIKDKKSLFDYAQLAPFNEESGFKATVVKDYSTADLEMQYLFNIWNNQKIDYESFTNKHFVSSGLNDQQQIVSWHIASWTLPVSYNEEYYYSPIGLEIARFDDASGEKLDPTIVLLDFDTLSKVVIKKQIHPNPNVDNETEFNIGDYNYKYYGNEKPQLYENDTFPFITPIFNNVSDGSNGKAILDSLTNGSTNEMITEFNLILNITDQKTAVLSIDVPVVDRTSQPSTTTWIQEPLFEINLNCTKYAFRLFGQSSMFNPFMIFKKEDDDQIDHNNERIKKSDLVQQWSNDPLRFNAPIINNFEYQELNATNFTHIYYYEHVDNIYDIGDNYLYSLTYVSNGTDKIIPTSVEYEISQTYGGDCFFGFFDFNINNISQKWVSIKNDDQDLKIDPNSTQFTVTLKNDNGYANNSFVNIPTELRIKFKDQTEMEITAYNFTGLGLNNTDTDWNIAFACEDENSKFKILNKTIIIGQ